MKEEYINISKKLFAKIENKANEENITFDEMIEDLYKFEPNTCKVFYENLQGDFFQRVNSKKKPVEPEELNLYQALNPESKVILVKRASLGPITERKLENY